jgi:hypothetical protein
VKRKKRRANRHDMALLSWRDKLERDSHELAANGAWIDACMGQSVIGLSEPSA